MQAPQRMQRSASRRSDASTLVRPPSTMMTWNSSDRPDRRALRPGGEGEVVADRLPGGRAREQTQDERHVFQRGQHLLDASNGTCTRGSVVVMRPLPSLVTMTVVPVSATRKLAPVTPCRRSGSAAASPTRLARHRRDLMLARRAVLLLEQCSDLVLVLWIAGAMMCEGRVWDT